eukprot:734451-Lingulodinium_polyedra.AAC.1
MTARLPNFRFGTVIFGTLAIASVGFHTIKPPGDKLAPQPPVVALTTYYRSKCRPQGRRARRVPA